MSEDLAYQFLEQLQAETPDSGGHGVPDDVLSRVLATEFGRPAGPEELDEYRSLLTAETSERPTRYENPLTFSTMKDLTGKIEGVIADNAIDMPVRPRFGTLASGQVNAMTIAVPGGGHLVVLERQLLTFANLISKAIALALPVTSRAPDGTVGFGLSPDQVIAHLDADPTAVLRFAETVVAYVMYGRPTAAPSYILDRVEYQRLASTFRDSLELFVVGHEYAHVLAGHVGAGGRPARGLSAGSLAVTEVDYGWLQEFEADITGARLGAAAMQRSDQVGPGFAFSGSEIYFCAMDVMDRAVSLLQFGDESARRLGTHPPSDLRREMLRFSVTKLGPEELATEVLDMGRTIQAIIDVLWDRTRVAMESFHRAGERPAPMWTRALTIPADPAAQEAM